MLSKVLSSTVVGMDAHLIEVEVDIGGGLPQFSVVGLPDVTVKESRDRVRAALKNTGFSFPIKRITVNLAPADLRKEGSGLDLAIAIGLLVAEEIVSREAVADKVFIGELSLDGQVKPVPGALAMSIAVGPTRTLIVPADNAVEAAMIEGTRVVSVRTLPEVVAWLQGQRDIQPTIVDRESYLTGSDQDYDDFADVKGQGHAKRALEIAAAGGHNVLMVGPPGSGKTMLARRVSGILPPFELDEALETTRIYSCAALLDGQAPLITARPFRAPHHSISDAGLIGGGVIPRPGEISLAHQGVLFLDEVLEFKRHVLDGLRQPLEEGVLLLTRANASVRYPARVMLIAAMNPCPCGYYGDRSRECLCTPYQIRRYRGRLSGPLHDRLDLHIEVPPVSIQDLGRNGPVAESSVSIRARVVEARARQRARYRKEGWLTNTQLKPKQLSKYCALNEEAHSLIEQAMARLGLSARAYGRILRVARTIADLAGTELIAAAHVAEAVQYRSLDRKVEG